MTAYLIELEDTHHPGCVVSGNALGICDDHGKVTGINPYPLWGDVSQALRFCRAEDARKAASVLVPAMSVVITEHVWE